MDSQEQVLLELLWFEENVFVPWYSILLQGQGDIDHNIFLPVVCKIIYFGQYHIARRAKTVANRTTYQSSSSPFDQTTVFVAGTGQDRAVVRPDPRKGCTCFWQWSLVYLRPQVSCRLFFFGVTMQKLLAMGSLPSVDDFFSNLGLFQITQRYSLFNVILALVRFSCMRIQIWVNILGRAAKTAVWNTLIVAFSHRIHVRRRLSRVLCKEIVFFWPVQKITRAYSRLG
ncbi:hypothetical protein PHYBLDRAFT_66195 [Phycomyces blakesleeanus NRRL 1555(-)]|uniref:Uncharacterized protein n=1 Tax=Phycomyces blakesleeanus (strain ATCC 8743b / DSM 1359 / FGSC 10004 / NBRC 33097 / NRRL 1555) TaxID=763407 RepID=A0A162TT51_PHYB8|nr:hypothetical protein PHYBLDRAFT_66195 [Phycomyces blakesleeanus NRRL 1555(-)]OAD69583.1 hypothetical protein PHYBLDRAFT_66195 [Phycomyces blakesleeanus NRRL 1555(-)]|eukprot:XP_018287623.1 hypothetical protein PHYBLDRAFT_66195 [Phycomyces blakesleeanus NRRL 1555(-)]